MIVENYLSLFSTPITIARVRVARIWSQKPLQVNFYATLREITGTKTVVFEWEEGITAGILLERIFEQYPLLREQLLDQNGGLYGHVHFMVNGRDVRFLEKQLETALNAEDVISVFPAVGGG